MFQLECALKIIGHHHTLISSLGVNSKGKAVKVPHTLNKAMGKDSGVMHQTCLVARTWLFCSSPKMSPMISSTPSCVFPIFVIGSYSPRSELQFELLFMSFGQDLVEISSFLCLEHLEKRFDWIRASKACLRSSFSPVIILQHPIPL